MQILKIYLKCSTKWQQHLFQSNCFSGSHNLLARNRSELLTFTKVKKIWGQITHQSRSITSIKLFIVVKGTKNKKEEGRNIHFNNGKNTDSPPYHKRDELKEMSHMTTEDKDALATPSRS